MSCLTLVKEPLNDVASGWLAVAAGAQEAECIWQYMSIPSTAGRRQTHAQ